MTDRSKALATEKRIKLQAARENLRNARKGAVSRSDQHELKEEGSVFQEVDEDEYNKIVETRREAGDFVVDDDGLGYYDDGEEHTGQVLDAYDTRKALLQDAEDEDGKKLKKKAKYMQSNTMFNYAKSTAFNNIASTKAVASSDKGALSIDSLLDSGGDSGRARKPRPVVKVRGGAARSSSSSSHGHGYHEQDGDYHQDEQQYQYDEPSEPMDQDNDNAPATTSESMSAEEVSVKAEAADSAPPAIEESSKISLSSTKSKMKAAVRKPVPAAEGVNFTLQPSVDSNNSFHLMSEIAGENAPAAASSQGGSASAIDSMHWVQRETVTNEAGEAVQEEFLNMWWMDATEIHGTIYLFGKVLLNDNKPVQGGSGSGSAAPVKRFVSCCVAVHGVERNLFVLPRVVSTDVGGDPVRASFTDVHKELTSMLVPSIIPKQAGVAGGLFRCKKVKRKYAFDLENIPREETDYLKVVYSAKHGVPSHAQCSGLNSNGTLNKTIEQIFGHSYGALEMFLVKRKLMGPCWIKVKSPKMYSDPVSWCKVECAIENPKLVVKLEGADVPPNPPLTSICLSMKTAVNPQTHTHEIIALSGIVHTNTKADEDTKLILQEMKKFTMVRALGTSCGNDYPHVFPHDLDQCIQKQVGNTGVLTTFPNERALLSMFFVKIQQEDPDIFASHNLFGFEFEVLFNRAIANKLPGNSWSKIGRLRRSKPPNRGIQDRDATPGRILCDTYKASKEFLRETTYSLTHLAHSQLNYDRVEVDPIDVPKYFSNSQHIVNLANHTSADAFLVQRLMLKLQVVPLTKQLTTVSGNLWSRTARGARAERIEFLLLHEFHAIKYILPEKKAFSNDDKGSSASNKKGGARTVVNEDHMDEDELNEHADPGSNKVGGQGRKRAKAAYAGGLVLEPKKGLYDTYILLLDFNSLYPSLIQEYDLCFTTLNWAAYMTPPSNASNTLPSSVIPEKRKKGDEDEEEDDEEMGEVGINKPNLPPLPPKTPGQFKGVLPRVIKSLVDRRRQVKAMLKKETDMSKRQQLDIRQKALKLTANSMYGCLGFTFSRFYARPIAALVTLMGRETLQRTCDIATQQLGLDIIYGDTDSIMINTNLTDLKLVNEIGQKVKTAVNKLYESLELEIDGVFKSMLLLKKKKYAAVTITEKVVPNPEKGGAPLVEIEYAKEMKGLDLVRRDWCPLSKDAGKYVLDQILSGNTKEDIVESIHNYMSELATSVRANGVPLEQFVVTKGLNKNPKEYPDAKNQPHLQVALRMLANNKPVNIGDHIPYVICINSTKTDEDTKSQSSSLIASRAYHPDEVSRSEGTLTVDYEWYLNNQILPPISRLCEPIDGTSIAILSTQLGLDASKYTSRGSSGIDDLLSGDTDWGFTPSSKMDDAERFKDCAPIMIQCRSCLNTSQFKGVTGIQSVGDNGLSCGECGSNYFGRNLERDCYCLLSNQITLSIRTGLKKYYDCWMVCDDRMCGRRTMQQSVRGTVCTAENCHGRMLQEYSEKDLHTQLIYIESLVDVPRCVLRKKAAKVAANLTTSSSDDVVLNDSDTEIYSLLKQHMSNTVQWSAYNWIRPSLWSAMFQHSSRTTSNNKTLDAIVQKKVF